MATVEGRKRIMVTIFHANDQVSLTSLYNYVVAIVVARFVASKYIIIKEVVLSIS